MNLFIGGAGDDKMLSRVENRNQKLFLIPDSAVKTNLLAAAACCRFQAFVLNCGLFHIQDAIEIYMYNFYLNFSNSTEMR